MGATIKSTQEDEFGDLVWSLMHIAVFIPLCFIDPSIAVVFFITSLMFFWFRICCFIRPEETLGLIGGITVELIMLFYLYICISCFLKIV